VAACKRVMRDARAHVTSASRHSISHSISHAAHSPRTLAVVASFVGSMQDVQQLRDEMVATVARSRAAYAYILHLDARVRDAEARAQLAVDIAARTSAAALEAADAMAAMTLTQEAAQQQQAAATWAATTEATEAAASLSAPFAASRSPPPTLVLPAHASAHAAAAQDYGAAHDYGALGSYGAHGNYGGLDGGASAASAPAGASPPPSSWLPMRPVVATMPAVPLPSIAAATAGVPSWGALGSSLSGGGGGLSSQSYGMARNSSRGRGGGGGGGGGRGRVGAMAAAAVGATTLAPPPLFHSATHSPAQLAAKAAQLPKFYSDVFDADGKPKKWHGCVLPNMRDDSPAEVAAWLAAALQGDGTTQWTEPAMPPYEWNEGDPAPKWSEEHAVAAAQYCAARVAAALRGETPLDREGDVITIPLIHGDGPHGPACLAALQVTQGGTTVLLNWAAELRAKTFGDRPSALVNKLWEARLKANSPEEESARNVLFMYFTWPRSVQRADRTLLTPLTRPFCLGLFAAYHRAANVVGFNWLVEQLYQATKEHQKEQTRAKKALAAALGGGDGGKKRAAQGRSSSGRGGKRGNRGSGEWFDDEEEDDQDAVDYAADASSAASGAATTAAMGWPLLAMDDVSDEMDGQGDGIGEADVAAYLASRGVGFGFGGGAGR